MCDPSKYTNVLPFTGRHCVPDLSQLVPLPTPELPDYHVLHDEPSLSPAAWCPACVYCWCVSVSSTTWPHVLSLLS